MLEIERGGSERRILEQLDREATLAHEQLRSGDVDRACGLQGDDAVDAACSEVAERQGERAHHAHATGEVEHRADAIGDDRSGRALEGEDLDGLLRSECPELCAVEECAPTALGGPLLARSEVVDVPERDVAHRRALGEREREREERDPALRVHRPVDGIDHDPPGATGAEGALPELLGDEDEVLTERGEPLDDGVFGRLIDGRRVVASDTDLQNGLPLDARGESLEHVPDVRDTQATRLEPGRHGVTGWKRRPERGFG